VGLITGRPIDSSSPLNTSERVEYCTFAVTMSREYPERKHGDAQQGRFTAYDIASYLNESALRAQLPVGAGKAVMLKNQHRHSNPAPTLSAGVRAF
jgi:hypothetical protein